MRTVQRLPPKVAVSPSALVCTRARLLTKARNESLEAKNDGRRQSIRQSIRCLSEPLRNIGVQDSSILFGGVGLHDLHRMAAVDVWLSGCNASNAVDVAFGFMP